MDKYTVDQFVKVAKRENNKKRKYLYVNPLQGKHIPVIPQKALNVFKDMALLLDGHYSGERILAIGFAETATAIGFGVAFYSDTIKYCTQTTREKYDDAKYIHFTEIHSHATAQSLIVNNYDTIISQIDRIIFVEDEVTTGNTICRLIDELNKKYKGLKYGILSILNSMSEKRLLELKKRDITCVFLKKIPFEYHSRELEEFDFKLSNSLNRDSACQYTFQEMPNYYNPRYCYNVKKYFEGLSKFLGDFENRNNICSKRILILGTEEFMFFGLKLGELLQNKGMSVKFHATTRSPIMVSESEEYPLHSRFELISFYDKKRKTYIYNLERYDEVYVLTDSPHISEGALEDICAVLGTVGCRIVNILRWKSE